MKGVSAVIATIMMLAITIALAGMAYMFISGSFTAQTGKLVEIDAGATYCSGNTVYMYIKDIGTTDFTADKVNIFKQGQNPAACSSTADNVRAGGASVNCTSYTTGISAGANTMVVSGASGGPTNTVRATVYC